jgi:hypothetical protein
VSVALAAGIAAARGEVLIVSEAGEQYPPDQILVLLAQLARADLVFGRRRLGAWAKLVHRLARIPRWLLLGLEVRDPDCLFWAAHREAVEGLQLTRGMYRYVPWLVAVRGFRVSETYVEHRPQPRRWRDSRPNPGDLLAAWWLSRRSRSPAVREMNLAPRLRVTDIDSTQDGTSTRFLRKSA